MFGNKKNYLFCKSLVGYRYNLFQITFFPCARSEYNQSNAYKPLGSKRVKNIKVFLSGREYSDTYTELAECHAFGCRLHGFCDQLGW